MPANISKVQLLLDRELEKKITEAPLELRSIEELFSEEGVFRGPDVFIQDDRDEPGNVPPNTGEPSPNQPTTVSDSVNSILQQEKKNSHLFSQISKEETEDILAKLSDLVRMPPGQLDSESELYLEQQLSEVLGFQVSSELEGHRLLYNTGKVTAMPHIKLHPTDTLQSHAHPYAGLSKHRGAYGWFLEQGKVSDESEKLEKYYCALPLYYFPEWQTDSKAVKKWYKHTKIIILNPIENTAVICAVGTIGPLTQSRYQFGASPETIIAGKIWSPQAAGRVLILFIEDTENTILLVLSKIFKEI